MFESSLKAHYERTSIIIEVTLVTNFSRQTTEN